MNNAKHYDLFILIQGIRNFFNEKGFLDVLTPPVVENPGMEAHIHPFKVESSNPNFKNSPGYLHSSPEFFMKELLANGHEKIFTLSYCFRDEPKSETHRPQFLMLEWYRRDEFYSSIMNDCEELIHYSLQFLKEKNISIKESLEKQSIEKLKVDDLFKKILGFSILDFLEAHQLKEKIKKDFSELYSEHEDLWPWEDYFFLLFLNKIEPELKKIPLALVYEYPAPLAALSTLNSQNEKVCDRFELYIEGIEVANCFNELTDYKKQVQRFKEEEMKKESLYKYSLPWPKRFLETLENGYPKSSGIALGVERLLMSLTPNKQPFFD
ncbi:MAG: EF-P lysine aminoacylase GenX [Oligoflexia bacterium]|nr:EF-P lysine aminoacylase GenX [Oligoflexia bacterium]